MNYAVILAGGVGERFWPASTPEMPKQLLALISDKSMLLETAERLNGVVAADHQYVFTNAALLDAVAAECPAVPAAMLVGEPEGKNTAPAIGLAAGLVAASDADGVLLALPADHAVANVEAFRESTHTAFQIAAENDVLVLFGVVPDRPEVGYGYVERGSTLGPGAGEGFEVAAFLEKPDAKTARDLCAGGRHYWNSGLFCGQARVFLAEYEKHLPLMHRAIGVAVRDWDDDPATACERYYATVESTSIDYGIMQKTDRAVVLPAADWGWDDVGSWEALARWVKTSPEGNTLLGNCLLEECRDVIAFCRHGQVAALGVSDCVIVRTEEATLVVSRDMLDRLKPFVRAATADRPDR